MSEYSREQRSDAGRDAMPPVQAPQQEGPGVVPSPEGGGFNGARAARGMGGA